MPSPEESTVNNHIQKKEEAPRIDTLPPREITQTDHINKKLLTSLFNRLDEGGESSLSKMLEDDNKTTEDDEWYD